MEYARNRRYFQPVDLKWGVLLAAVGAIIMVMSVPVGLLILALGVALIVLQFVGKPSDQDIDAMMTSRLSDLKERALESLGVSENEVAELDPISFDGYIYENASIHRGRDGRERSDRYQAVMFLFSSNAIHCFTCEFSITRQDQRESTDICFYQDIAAISTDSTRYRRGRDKRSGQEQGYIRLTTTGGSCVVCAVRDMDEAREAVDRMRTLVKAKKGTAQGSGV